MIKAILGLVILAALACVVAAQYGRPITLQRTKFRELPVTRGNLQIGVSATGTVEPVEIIDVGAQIVGSIKQFGPDPDRPGKTIDYRSRVRAGDVLARLDDLPHRAELEKANASLRIAQAEQQRARARQAQTERDMRRSKNLGHYSSAAALDADLAANEIAKAELAMADAKVEQAKVALRQAEINLGYTTISSPIDGVVIDRRVNIGQTVVAGLNAPSLFLLAKDLRRMFVWAAVNEADIGDVHVGQKVTFKVDAYRDRTFHGTVSQIRLNASLAQNVVTYGVVVDVENGDGKLLPYMTAKLHFEVASRSDVVLVPNQALRWKPVLRQVSPEARGGLVVPPPKARPVADKEAGQDDDSEPTVEVARPTVWVTASEGFVRPITVKVGLSDGVTSEITDGKLAPGARVVVNVLRETSMDFVSSFVTSVTKSKK